MEMCIDDIDKDDKMQAAQMADVGLPQSFFLCVPLLLIVWWQLGEEKTCQHNGRREGKQQRGLGPAGDECSIGGVCFWNA